MGALLGDQRLQGALESLKRNIAGAVNNMPRHQDFLKSYCALTKGS